MSDDAEIEEIWQLFSLEGEDALNNSEECLIALEEDQSNHDQICVLFRSMHTFKGMAGMMGMANIESIAHKAEDLIGLVRDHGVAFDDEILQIMLATLDKMRSNFEFAVMNRHDVDADENSELLAKQVSCFQAKDPNQESQENISSEEVDSESEINSEASVVTEQKDTVAETQEQDDTSEAEVEDAETNSTVTDTIDSEPQDEFNPGQDENYIKIFLEMADKALAQINDHLDELLAHDDNAVANVSKQLDNIAYAAKNMNYVNVEAVASQFIEVLQQKSEPDNITQKQVELVCELDNIRALISAAQEETIQDVNQDAEGPVNVSSAFSQSLTDNMRQSLEQADDLTQSLKDNYEKISKIGGGDGSFDSQVTNISELFRGLYQNFIFYDRIKSAQLSLTLQDIYARVNQRELMLGRSMLNVTQQFIDIAKRVVKAIESKTWLEEGSFDDINHAIKELVINYDDSEAARVARNVIELLNMPEKMHELLTEENITSISQAFGEDKYFYLLNLDVDSDEEVGMRFYEWSQSEDFDLITNITEFKDEKSTFTFLIASYCDDEEFASQILDIDPQGKYSEYQACQLQFNQLDTLQFDYQDDFNADMLSVSDVQDEKASDDNELDVMETVGELVTSQAALQHIVNQLDDDKLVEDLMAIINQGGDLHRLRINITNLLDEWKSTVKNQIGHIANDFGNTLDHVREVAFRMREKDISKQAGQINHFIREISEPLGKKIKLNLNVDDIKVDKGIAGTLLETLCDLVKFIVYFSVEDYEARQEAGKDNVANLKIEFLKTNELLSLNIHDDGKAFSPDMVNLLMTGELFNSNELSDVEAQVYQESQTIFDKLRQCNGRVRYQRESDQNFFQLQFPTASMVIDGMVVEYANVRYVIPIKSIERIVRPNDDSITHYSSDGGHYVLHLQDKLIPIVDLKRNGEINISEESIFVVVEEDGKSLAFNIDRLVEQQQVLSQPLSGIIAEIPNITGCALLGGGDVGMVVDVSELIAQYG